MDFKVIYHSVQYKHNIFMISYYVTHSIAAIR